MEFGKESMIPVRQGKQTLSGPMKNLKANLQRAAITYGLIRIMIVHLPYFIYGLMDVSTGALRGLGSSLTPMVISILGVCGLRVGWVYTIFQMQGFHTPQCLYTSYPISWIITFACQITAFVYVYRKKVTQERVKI